MKSMQRVWRTHDPQRRDAVRSVALAALLVLGGCLTRKPEGTSLSPVALTYSVPLTIESRFREDVTVFVLHDGIASRLTRAGSASTTKFVIPKHLIGSLGEISLLLEPVGSRSGMADRVQSPRVRVLPGQSLLWTLESNLSRSFLEIVPSDVIRPDTVKTGAD